jgi:hypothetical protein
MVTAVPVSCQSLEQFFVATLSVANIALASPPDTPSQEGVKLPGDVIVPAGGFLQTIWFTDMALLGIAEIIENINASAEKEDKVRNDFDLAIFNPSQSS